jgi:hypothetical protein
MGGPASEAAATLFYQKIPAFRHAVLGENDARAQNRRFLQGSDMPMHFASNVITMFRLGILSAGLPSGRRVTVS